MPSADLIQLPLTLKMTTAQGVGMSVTVNIGPFQDYDHRDDHAPPTYDTSFCSN